MKQLIVCAIFVLTGCASQSVPVNLKFPSVPADLLTACPDLKSVDPKTTQLSDVLDVVIDNYTTYYECKTRTDDWIEWYNTQKTIFDKVSK